jgi:hypothetical protein
MKQTKIVNKRGSTKLACSIACPPVKVDGLLLSYQPSFTLEADRFGPAELKKALADSEMITSLLREYPREMSEIVNLVLSGQMDAAVEIALKIGLTEEAFQRNGGGLWWWLIVVVGGAILITAATKKP